MTAVPAFSTELLAQVLVVNLVKDLHLSYPLGEMSDLRKALLAKDLRSVAAAVRTAEETLVRQLDVALPRAVAGANDAVGVVVRNWDALLRDILSAAAVCLPAGRVVPHAGEFVVRSPSGEELPELLPLLRSSVAHAPFTSLLGTFGPGTGLAVACVAEVRDVFPELASLPSPRAEPWGLRGDVDVLRYGRLVDLAVRGLAPPLERVQEALALTDGELGDLFGVSRQAIAQWRDRGVPGERRAKLSNLVSVVDVLDRKLKPGRLPLVVRRPAEAFEGRTLLEVVAADRDAELRETIDRAFDWSTAA